MNYDEYIRRRERRSPEFKALRDENRPVDAFQIAIVGARLRAGLTQAQLADRIGVPQSSVARWESGANIPTITTLLRIAKALNIDFRVTRDGILVEHSDAVPA
jgi:transcriptional regulator with XRE-family HTH domain